MALPKGAGKQNLHGVHLPDKLRSLPPHTKVHRSAAGHLWRKGCAQIPAGLSYAVSAPNHSENERGGLKRDV